MKVAGLLLILIGTLFVGAEGLGRERAQLMEERLLHLGRKTQELYGKVLYYMLFPPYGRWKTLDNNPYRSIVAPKWSYLFFLAGSIISLVVVAPRADTEVVLPNGLHAPLAAIGLASYFGLVLSSLLASGVLLLIRLVVEKSATTSITVKVLARALALPLLIPISLILILLVLLTFLGTMAFSFPAALIIGLFAALYILSGILTFVIQWKDSHHLGSIFIIFGTVALLTGALLMYFG